MTAKSRAKKGEHYYIIDADGSVIQFEEFNDVTDNVLYEYGNYFKTEEQAESVASAIRGLFKQVPDDPQKYPAPKIKS